MIAIRLEYIVNDNEEGSTITHILRDKLQVSSRLLNKLKMNEKILVNNIPVFSSHVLHSGDNIVVNIDFIETDSITPLDIPLDILYEDEYLLAVSKEAGMVVHPSSFHPDNTLANGVKFYLNNNKKIRPINRLDRDTSGIVLFAKNEYIQELMIKEKQINKEYLAIACGILENKVSVIDKPIARKAGSIMEREINEENGQSAITYYTVLNEQKEVNLTFLRLKLNTGRTHQIRVHLSSLGNAILGDTLYGCETNLIERQALHAWKMSFEHPITKEEIIIVSRLPDDIKKIANMCGFEEPNN